MSAPATAPWSVRVPASSANLGPGFDVLGLALDLVAEIGSCAVGAPPDGARVLEPTHPAAVAHGSAGGVGELWAFERIPAGRGLGFSGAMHVGGALLAFVERCGGDPEVVDEVAAEVFEIAAGLEGHGDNVAASLRGGVVAVAGSEIIEIPCILEPSIVVWIPDAVTRTSAARAQLDERVDRNDAVFNIARTAVLVTALQTGRTELLALGAEDRLHQSVRLANRPESARAIRTAMDAGAWSAWLSGSGPTVAAMCAPDAADAVKAAVGSMLGSSGAVRTLRLDRRGAEVVTGVAG
jgi:homoserine kinase